MRILFEGTVSVAYHQLYVVSGDETCSFDAAFAGQSNGLCGAAEPGRLTLIAAPHSADIPVRVELHASPPPLEAAWEDVVEVSFTPLAPNPALEQWGGGGWDTLELPVQSYRVRYLVDQLDEDELEAEEDLLWHTHVLQLWAAPPARDEVIRVTSQHARHCHEHARKQPPPPSPQQIAEAERQRAEQQRREHEASRRILEERDWGGRLPSAQLRLLRAEALQLAALDRDLLDTLDRARPEAQRGLAVWAAHKACELTGMTERAWIADALLALDHAEPLPAPFDDFDDRRAAFEKLFEGYAQGTLHAVLSEVDQRPLAEQISTRTINPHAALSAVFGAGDPDPLRGACAAIMAALWAAGPEHLTVLAELRQLLAARG